MVATADAPVAIPAGRHRGADPSDGRCPPDRPRRRQLPRRPRNGHLSTVWTGGDPLGRRSPTQVRQRGGGLLFIPASAPHQPRSLSATEPARAIVAPPTKGVRRRLSDVVTRSPAGAPRPIGPCDNGSVATMCCCRGRPRRRELGGVADGGGFGCVIGVLGRYGIRVITSHEACLSEPVPPLPRSKLAPPSRASLPVWPRSTSLPALP